MKLLTGLILFICAASFAFVLAEVTDDDDDGEEVRSARRRVKFTLKTSEELNWNKAREACERENKRHASIRNLNEQTKIMGQITRAEAKESFWVAGTTGRATNLFDWFVTTPDDEWYERFTFTYWTRKEPTFAPEEARLCVLLSPPLFTWKTANCSERHNFICEQDL